MNQSNENIDGEDLNLNNHEDLRTNHASLHDFSKGLDLNDSEDDSLSKVVDDFTNEKKELEILELELEKKKKTYWTENTEKSVIEFLNHDCNYFNVKLEKYFQECEKNRITPDFEYVEELQKKYEWASQNEIISKKELIYRKHIHKPLNRLIENIIFNFKLFRPGVDIKTTQSDCLSFVYGKFANFNPDQNSKSFSFFGTIAKHYLMGEKKDIDKSQQVNLDYDDHKEEADRRDVVELDEKSALDSSYELFMFITDSLENEINKKLANPNDKKNLSDNDLKVADAIVQIFKSHEILGAYYKNQAYHLIKEYTGLQTKDITYSLARFRVLYRLLKQNFIKKSLEND